MLSLIFWTMTIIVSLKYVLLILRADNNGEGGLIAMLALATHARCATSPPLRRALMTVGLFGTAIFYGDGVITPAISVLSARSRAWASSRPRCSGWVQPLSLLVIVRPVRGRSASAPAASARPSGRSPWCGSSCWCCSACRTSSPTPRCWYALNPGLAIGFFAQHRGWPSSTLGAVVLCVTGGEALYADMGHFGKLPIRIAWYGS